MTKWYNVFILSSPVSFEKQFTSIEELSKQNDIRYGLVRNGATAQLFSVLKYFELCYSVFV